MATSNPLSPQLAVTDPHVLDHILKKLNQLDILDTIKQDIQDLKDIKNVVTDLTKSIQFTQGQVDSVITTHQQVQSDNTWLKEQVKALHYQNSFLMDKVIQLEDYSRQENIKLYQYWKWGIIFLVKNYFIRLAAIHAIWEEIGGHIGFR